MAMKLRAAMILAGGPGSGCNPEVGKCGRPRTRELSEGGSTEDHYKDATTGQWDLERQQLHQKVIDEMTAGKTAPVGRRPVVYVLGGGTASGKTTASRKILGDDPNVLRVDPDELKTKIPEYEGLKQTDPKNASLRVHEESSYMTKKLMAEGIARGLDMTYDATTSGRGSPTMVQGLIDHGYDVHLMFVDVPIKTAIERAEIRAKESLDPMNRGRHVPESVIQESHARAASNFFVLKDAPGIKSVRLYDNSGHYTPELVYSKKQFQPEEIHNEQTYAKYRKKALQEYKVSAVHGYGFGSFSYA